MSHASRMARALVACSLTGLALVATAPAQAEPSELAPKHVMLTLPAAASDQAQQAQEGAAKPNRPGSTSNGINYHNGPLILGGTNVYVIWYGDWTNNTGPAIITDFLNSIGGSPYFNINTTYYDVNKTSVTNKVTFPGSTTDGGKTSLSDADIQAIVANSIGASPKLPSDPNGVYFVLTAAHIQETSGFLTKYCGWHTHATIGTTDIKYSFVGDPTDGMSACAAQTTSPNGNAPADAMVSVIAHELEEATTDPDLNAWYDTRGYENADKCAWTFGTTYTVSNGSSANMKLGTRDYLIQRNWVNANGGSCKLAYP